jgi:hypothetical protein
MLTAAPAPRELTRNTGRIVVVTAAVLAVLFVWRVSLILSSDPLDPAQRQAVTRALLLLDSQGFPGEVTVLRHLAAFRSSDNWWNRFVGHSQAYAATNFPFEVVTLYPWFFTAAVDDNERAIILLHESHHLLGRGENEALERVWRAKTRLGWHVGAYGHTRVWKNTAEWTRGSLPHLFTCGDDGQSDCLE